MKIQRKSLFKILWAALIFGLVIGTRYSYKSGALQKQTKKVTTAIDDIKTAYKNHNSIIPTPNLRFEKTFK